jgi:hypothetical protein
MKNLITFEEFVNESVNESYNLNGLCYNELGECMPKLSQSDLTAFCKEFVPQVHRPDSPLIKDIQDYLKRHKIECTCSMEKVIGLLSGRTEYINETAMPAFVKTAIKELAHTMPNHTKPDSDGNFNDAQIKAAIMKYSPVLKQAFKNGLESDIIDGVKEIVNESVNEGSISGMKLKALGAKLLTKISIGSEFVTDKDTYTVTDFGPKSNAFQEFFVTDSKGNAKKVKLTVMFGLKLEVNDDPRSAVYRREEMLSSINENLNERRVSFKGKTTNDLYRIVNYVSKFIYNPTIDLYGVITIRFER